MIKKIKEEVIKYSKLISAEVKYLPTFEENRNDGHPDIIEICGLFYYVIKERDVEYSRDIFNNEEDLLFKVFSDITFEMSKEFELDNRKTDKDSRRLIFKKQNELLGKINKSWRFKQEVIQKKILDRYPYNDNLPSLPDGFK